MSYHICSCKKISCVVDMMESSKWIYLSLQMQSILRISGTFYRLSSPNFVWHCIILHSRNFKRNNLSSLLSLSLGKYSDFSFIVALNLQLIIEYVLCVIISTAVCVWNVQGNYTMLCILCCFFHFLFLAHEPCLIFLHFLIF